MKMIKACILLMILSGCADQSTPGEKITSAARIEEGGLYYSQSKDGVFRVSKILAVDSHAFHVRIYANKFKEPPVQIRSSELTMGGMNSPEGFGIGHAPMDKSGFLSGGMHFIRKEKVMETELEGYRYYLKSMKKP